MLKSNLDTEAVCPCRGDLLVALVVVHGNESGTGEEAIEWATNFLASYREAQLPKPKSVVSSSSHWHPPCVAQVKINYDVGYVDSISYRVSIITRDSGGHCLWGRVRRIIGQPPAAVLEARAAREGVLLA